MNPTASYAEHIPYEIVQDYPYHKKPETSCSYKPSGYGFDYCEWREIEPHPHRLMAVQRYD
ncbi:hypothetical protein D3C85_1880370 [compost metagenome]